MKAPGFTGGSINRADNLRLDGDRIAGLMRSLRARLLRLATLDPELDEQGRLAWGSLAELEEEVELIFLGLEGETPLFAPLPRVTPGQRAWAVFGILGRMAPEDAALWGTARSLIEWHNKHRFCGHCGGATHLFRAGWGRKCGSCAMEHFPRVDPVVIMLAEHNGRVLLGRQPQYPAGRYSALAGFVEPGEAIEEAVARELFEEAGIRASDVRYVASQPWPFPGQLMIACIAQAQDDVLTIDTTEIEDAFWATRDEVRDALAGEPAARFLAPPPFAIAYTLLVRWLGT